MTTTKTKERPILFNAAMVRAILDGRKTQTRRLVKNHNAANTLQFLLEGLEPCDWLFANCPYGKEGHGLWVRENFSVKDLDHGYQNPNVCDDFLEPSCTVRFFDGQEERRVLIQDSDMGIDDIAQAERAMKKKTVPSIHMPRWASRIDLLIKDVRVERVQDISHDDAAAEGFASISKDGTTYKYGIPDLDGLPGSDNLGWDWPRWNTDPRLVFMALWESINGKESWFANPWVWVVEFERIKP